MTQIIGIVLILFGIAGLVGSLALFWWLTRPQGPIDQARQRLLKLSTQLHEGSVSVQSALQTAQAVRTFLLDYRDKVQEISGLVTQLRDQVIQGINLTEVATQKLEAIALPKIDSIAHSTLPAVSVSVPVITGVSLGETTLTGGITVTTPPLRVERGAFDLSFPSMPVVSGVSLITTHPLQELGPLSTNARDILKMSAAILALIVTTNLELANRPAEVRTKLDELINNALMPLQASLQEGSIEARLAADRPWLRLAPLLGLGCLALLHVAFGLTGLALLFV